MERAFAACSALSLLAAGYHAMVLAGGFSAVAGSPVRHGIFVGLGVAGAVGLRRRPRWLPIAFTAVTVQQVLSHGQRAWHWWSADRSIDWLSMIVLLAMPLACCLVIWDWLFRFRAKAGG